MQHRSRFTHAFEILALLSALVSGFLSVSLAHAEGFSDFIQEIEAKTECASLVGSCEYYRCREQIQPCGEDGYFLRFGYHYCSEFMERSKPKLNATEGKWLDQVAACLQRAVEKIPTTSSCTDVEDLAIDSHVECYLSTGYCEQPLEVKTEILEVIYPELRDHRIDGVMIHILTGCAEGE
jgi:hypothetical protein